MTELQPPKLQSGRSKRTKVPFSVKVKSFFVALFTFWYKRDKNGLLDFVMNLLGLGSVEYTSSKKTVDLVLKSTGNVDEKTVSLRTLVEGVVPPVRLNPIMFNGHIQTIYVSTNRGQRADIHYKRKIFTSNHTSFPGEFAVDFVVPTPADPQPRDRSLPARTHHFSDEDFSTFVDDKDDTSKPLLVVLHGLCGGSHEQYIRHAIKPLTSKEGGWSAAVINARGCCYSKITTSYLFNARATWDIRQFVAWARQKWPNRRIFGIGFSLGANIMCNYVGEEGENCELEAAILVGSPWNLDVANAIMRSTFIGDNLYQAALGSGLRKLFKRCVPR